MYMRAIARIFFLFIIFCVCFEFLLQKQTVIFKKSTKNMPKENVELDSALFRLTKHTKSVKITPVIMPTEKERFYTGE